MLGEREWWDGFIWRSHGKPFIGWDTWAKTSVMCRWGGGRQGENQGRSKAGGENGTAKALRSGRAFKSGVRGKRTWILLYV